MHTAQHRSNRGGGLASYLHYATIPLGITLLIAGTTYFILSTTPRSSRLDMIHPHPGDIDERSYLRSNDHFMPSSALLHGPSDEYFTSSLVKQDDTRKNGDLLYPHLY